MSPLDEPVSDTEILSTNEETGTLWDNPDTCLRLNLLLDSKEDPIVVYNRLEFFRLMVARGVYSEGMAAASEWEVIHGAV